ncbi:MAG: replication-relaxation family protein [Solirubrobacteraceae bacterium]|jgi:hypothetical protein
MALAVLYGLAAAALLAGARGLAPRRARRRGTVRLLVEPYRNDRATPETLRATFAALHALLAAETRLDLRGRRGTLTLEIHLDRRSGGAPLAWFAISAPATQARHVEAALRASYPNLRLRALSAPLEDPPALVALQRRTAPHADGAVHSEPPVVLARGDVLLRALAAAGPPASVQLVLRPAAAVVEHALAAVLARASVSPSPPQPPRALFWAEPRVLAADRRAARAIASALRGSADDPRLMPAHRRTGRDARIPRTPRRLYRLDELSELWALPTPDFAALPCLRRALPLAPAPPGISRPRAGRGLLRDEHGGVTIDVELRRQHTAVVGAVEQGKTSFLVASAKEDLARERCALIVLDPKGDAADAVLSVVPQTRTCTLLDMAAPSVGFNPLAVDAAPDAIADQVVGALRALFSEGEVRGSSDRYLRNAIIAALACEPSATLWDVARLLEVGEAGRSARARAAERLLELPAYAEIATFLADELPVQLADARATTTAKLDAPANKLARVLNSPAIKRILQYDALRIDLDRLIERSEVLVVRGALGELGAGNVAVLMQLLLGMLDAALARSQDRRLAQERGAVALKVDEAPLVINETFAQTLALKRSAGLETVACWQTDAQWPIELREQLDALFAHRVLFATASSTDARSAAGLLLAEFSDQLRPADEQTMRLASPDVRLHLPRHTAIASWTTARGRERPFLASTLPLAIDRERIAHHEARQHERAMRLPAQSPQPTVQPPPPAPQLPVQAPGYLELRALDAATRVRFLPTAPARHAPTLDAGDRALLEWLAGARCALTTQIHRRLRPDQALTGTQRQLKRLADAGLVARFQAHRPDGGGVPQCCAVTAAALELLGLRGRVAPTLDAASLDSLRAAIHTTGWLLALEALAGAALREVLGPGRATIAPHTTPAELDLGDGVRARDFGNEAFVAVRPAAVAELVSVRGVTRDLLVTWETEVDVAQYDRLVSGWWRSVARYKRLGAPPIVVVLCADQDGARERARAANEPIRATLARIGTEPREWERPGRELIAFAAEGELHGGSLGAWRAPLQGEDEARRATLIELDRAASARPAQSPWR